MKNKKLTIKKLTVTGLMAALVFAASYVRIEIPTAIDKTAIHPGNIFCLLSGFILGGSLGGTAAGIGSFFFDLSNPLYVSSAFFTLIFKFLMAFVCGITAHSGKNKICDSNRSENFKIKYFIAAACGAFTYVILYLSKSFFSDILFLQVEIETAFINVAQKAAASSVNGIIAIFISVPLYYALKKSLKASGLDKNLL